MAKGNNENLIPPWPLLACTVCWDALDLGQEEFDPKYRVLYQSKLTVDPFGIVLTGTFWVKFFLAQVRQSQVHMLVMHVMSRCHVIKEQPHTGRNGENNNMYGSYKALYFIFLYRYYTLKT